MFYDKKKIYLIIDKQGQTAQRAEVFDKSDKQKKPSKIKQTNIYTHGQTVHRSEVIEKIKKLTDIKTNQNLYQNSKKKSYKRRRKSLQYRTITIL